MTLVEHAERELALAGVAGDDDYDGMLYEAVMELVRKFADQGHSGASAAMAVSMVEKLMRFEPLTPLTGDDTEWNDVSDVGGRDGGALFQNNRYSAVFKDDDLVYDIDAVVLVDPHGGGWMSNVREPIEFPYVPKQTHVKIDAHGRTLDRSLDRFDMQGFCGDDGCHCWEGEEPIQLEGDN